LRMITCGKGGLPLYVFPQFGHAKRVLIFNCERKDAIARRGTNIKDFVTPAKDGLRDFYPEREGRELRTLVKKKDLNGSTKSSHGVFEKEDRQC